MATFLFSTFMQYYTNTFYFLHPERMQRVLEEVYSKSKDGIFHPSSQNDEHFLMRIHTIMAIATLTTERSHQRTQGFSRREPGMNHFSKAFTLYRLYPEMKGLNAVQSLTLMVSPLSRS
jgi:hypothetical protein